MHLFHVDAKGNYLLASINTKSVLCMLLLPLFLGQKDMECSPWANFFPFLFFFLILEVGHEVGVEGEEHSGTPWSFKFSSV